VELNEHAKTAALLLRSRLKDEDFDGRLSAGDKDQEILKALWDSSAERLNAGLSKQVRKEIEELEVSEQELNEESARMQTRFRELPREDHHRASVAKNFNRVRASAGLVQMRHIILEQALIQFQLMGRVELSGEANAGSDTPAYDDFMRWWKHCWGLQNGADKCFIRASELLCHRREWELREAWDQIEKESKHFDQNEYPYHVSWAQFKQQFHKSKKYSVGKAREIDAQPLDIPLL
jgi:hypothetical protein